MDTGSPFSITISHSLREELTGTFPEMLGSDAAFQLGEMLLGYRDNPVPIQGKPADGGFEFVAVEDEIHSCIFGN